MLELVIETLQNSGCGALAFLELIHLEDQVGVFLLPLLLTSMDTQLFGLCIGIPGGQVEDAVLVHGKVRILFPPVDGVLEEDLAEMNHELEHLHGGSIAAVCEPVDLRMDGLWGDKNR